MAWYAVLPIGSPVSAAGTLSAVNKGCSGRETSLTACDMLVALMLAAPICAAVGLPFGIRPSTRWVISEVSGLRLARTVLPALAWVELGLMTEDSVAALPSASLNGAVKMKGAVPLSASVKLPLASVSAVWTFWPLLSVMVTVTPASALPLAATPLTVAPPALDELLPPPLQPLR